MSIYKKLHEIQKRVSGLGKDKASNSYSYVSGNKVLSVIKPLMDELGLLLKQEITNIDNSLQTYKVGIGTPREREKSEILSKVTFKFTWIDVETGESDVSMFGANGQNDWDKGVGSAMTYAERYFLLKFFHISTDEDDIDNPNRKDKKWATTQDIKNYAYSLKYTFEDFKNEFKVRPEQEQEFNHYLDLYQEYPRIQKEIESLKTAQEVIDYANKLAPNIKADFNNLLNKVYAQNNQTNNNNQNNQ